MDVENFRTARQGLLRKIIGLGEDVPLALFVGNGFERKGLADAIAVVAALSHRTHLGVVGDDNGERETYAKIALDLGIGDRVHFLGVTDTPEVYFRDADFFLLPTYEDVWGIAVVEAMAAGVPVVTTDAAGASSLVETSGAGSVVPAGSVRSLREAAERLIANPSLRREMANRGRTAAKGFGLADYGERMIRHYERALGNRRSRPGNT